MSALEIESSHQSLAVFQESCDNFSKLEWGALLHSGAPLGLLGLPRIIQQFHTFHLNCHGICDDIV